jgi:hypothetical protein
VRARIFRRTEIGVASDTQWFSSSCGSSRRFQSDTDGQWTSTEPINTSELSWTILQLLSIVLHYYQPALICPPYIEKTASTPIILSGTFFPNSFLHFKSSELNFFESLIVLDNLLFPGNMILLHLIILIIFGSKCSFSPLFIQYEEELVSGCIFPHTFSLCTEWRLVVSPDHFIPCELSLAALLIEGWVLRRSCLDGL